MTYDQLAIRALLAGDNKALTNIQHQARRAIKVACGHICPECSGANVEDNGLPAGAFDFTILCHDCDDQFSPNAG